MIYFNTKPILCSVILPISMQTKYRERVVGLILVSPLCKAPSWTEWFYNKVSLKCLQFVRSQILRFDNFTKLRLLLILGDVKFAIFLWCVWCVERVSPPALLQQGIVMQGS